MVCSICRNSDHNARVCNDPKITETYQSIVNMLSSDRNNNTSITFARQIITCREKMPFWNNIWYRLTFMAWHRRNPYHPREVVMRFLQPRPTTLTEVKERFRSWINPPINRNTNFANNHLMIDELLRLNYNYSIQRPPLVMHAPTLVRPPPTPQVKIRMVMDDIETKYYDETDCVICMEPINSKNMVAYNCKHPFCASCVKTHVSKYNCPTCPICRVRVEKICFKSDLTPAYYNSLSEQISILA
jgi:hypothetical protein